MFRLLRRIQTGLGWLAAHSQKVMQANRIKISPTCRFVGVPYLHAEKHATIQLGQHVTLVSSNIFYHAQIFQRTKILADKPKASITIGANTRINGACIHAWRNIQIGENCLIAANVQIIDANGHAMCMDNPSQRLHAPDAPQPVIIGNNVWIGLNSIILPGTQLGDGCVVAAGSVVKGSFPSGCLIGGVPARVLKPSPKAE